MLYLPSQKKLKESDQIYALLFHRTPGYIQAQAMQTTDQTSVTSTSYEHDNQTYNAKGVICCRIIAITVSAGEKYRPSIRSATEY